MGRVIAPRWLTAVLSLSVRGVECDRNRFPPLTSCAGIRVDTTVVAQTMTKFVYDFAEGNKDLKDLLGGKGANLAEMTNMGLPVPPGFTITTEACQAYLATGHEPAELADEVSEHLADLERTMGKQLGQ